MNFAALFEKYDRLVLFDTETTGLAFARDEIIEFAAVVVENRGGVPTVIREYDELISLTPGNTVPPMIQQLTGFLMKHYRSNITLELAAKELGYSKFYISHAILERFDCNFRTLVNRYRISAAQEALQSSDKSVGEICYDCGFVNLSTFNRAFLKICGMTPTQYRQTQSTK